MHRPREADLVLVVHGDADEELGFPHRPANVLAQLVSSVDEVIRVTGDSRVSHVRELDLITARQEAVQYGRDLALQDKFTVDQLDFLPGCLRCSNASSLLSALGGWSIVFILVLEWGLEVVIVQRLLGLRQVRLTPHLLTQVVRLGAKDVIIAIVTKRDGNGDILCESRGSGWAREQGRRRQRTPWATSIAG